MAVSISRCFIALPRTFAAKTILSSLTLIGLLASTATRANTSPVIDDIDDVSVFVGDQVRFRVVPRDEDRHVPGVRLRNSPDGAVFSDNGDGTRTFSWVPGTVDEGTLTLTFEAFDALDSNLVTVEHVNVTVAISDNDGGNRAPEIESLLDQQIDAGGRFDFRVVPVDPEGIVSALHVSPLPAGASFSDNRDGTRQFRWQPSASGDLPMNFVFTAVDAIDATLSSTKTITLSLRDDSGVPDNTAPVFVELVDQSVALGETFEFRVTPRDADGDVPGMNVDRLPPGASFNDNRDGTRTFRWRPFPINLGDIFVTFEAIDARDSALRTRKTIRLSVFRDPNNPVNFPPVINGIYNPVIRAGDTLNQRVKPVDPDFIVPALEVLDPPSSSRFVDNLDGTRRLIWKTDTDDLGDTQVTFRTTDVEDPSLQFERTITISVVEQNSLNRRGHRLRNLADQRGFLIGHAAVLKQEELADNELYRDMAAQEFNIVTPENSHKMGWIQPRPGVFKWQDADKLANYAATNNMVLHGHPLVWFAQLPGWVLNLDPAQAENVMNRHIDALVSRYKGRVRMWDVVNEALEADGSLRESIWYRGMGERYIKNAFRRARAADPDAILIYNDYDVVWENTKSDAMYELIKRELANGTPIDAVGFQMHLRSGFDKFDSVKRNLQRFADLGVDIYITEFDVALDNGDSFEKQGELYRKSLEACLVQPACKSMQAWGFTDRYSWRSSLKPQLFSDKYIAKPAYYAWQQTLRDYLR